MKLLRSQNLTKNSKQFFVPCYLMVIKRRNKQQLWKSKYPIEESTAEKVRQWQRVWERAEEWDWGTGKINTLSPQTHPAVSPLLCSTAPLILKYWFCHLFYWPLKPMSAYRIYAQKNPVFVKRSMQITKDGSILYFIPVGKLASNNRASISNTKATPLQPRTATSLHSSLFFPGL